jgi:5'-nucleotidase
MAALPRILVCNDDGIDAPGLAALARELAALGEVSVVAPDRQQSAVGHAITMNYPLRAVPVHRDGAFFGTAVDGTPADAVKLAVRKLMPRPPDLLISGINQGSNVAINIIYSGTVSAATEGTILGIPSIAVSLASHQSTEFGEAARVARKLAVMVLERGLPPGTLLNVNVPAVPAGEIRGVRLTHQGKSSWVDTFDVRRDPANREYYWLTGRMNVTDPDSDADVVAVRERYVSVTPVQYDLTDRAMLARLRGWPLDDLR